MTRGVYAQQIVCMRSDSGSVGSATGVPECMFDSHCSEYIFFFDLLKIYQRV